MVHPMASYGFADWCIEINSSVDECVGRTLYLGSVACLVVASIIGAELTRKASIALL